MNFPWGNAHNRPILCVHLLDLPHILTRLNDVVIDLIPGGEPNELGTGNFRERVQDESIHC